MTNTFWPTETDLKIKELAQSAAAPVSRTSQEFMADVQKTLSDWVYESQDDAIRGVLEYAGSKWVTYKWIDSVKILWQLNDKIAAEKPTTTEKIWGFLTWVKETVEEPLKEIVEGGFNIVEDVKKISEWRIDEAPWLLGSLAQAWEKANERIIKLNKSIDETWGTFFDKVIWFWLNSVWAWMDFGWDVIVSWLKTLAPEWIERMTAEGIENFSKSEFWQEVIWLVQEGWEKWEQFKQTSPEANRLGLSIESVLPLAEFATWWVTAKLGKETLETGLEVWAKKWKELIETWEQIIEKWKEGIWNIKEKVSEITLPDLPSLWNKPSQIAENIAWIDEQTKNILKESTTEDFNRYVQAGKDAKDNIKNPSPMDIAGQEALDVLQDITNRKKWAGRRMWNVVKANPDVTVNTSDLLINYDDFLKNRFNLQVDPKTLKISPIKWKEAKTSDIKLIETLNDNVLSIITKENIGIEDLEAISTRIKSGFSKILTDRGVWSKLSPDEKSLKWFITWEITSMIKKNLPEEYTIASNDFARLLDLEERLAKLLWDGGDKGASFIKSAYSPQTWARFRRLAEEILEETGIDLTTKAGLAKFAMQLAWDPRQASLLEALDLWEGFTSKLTSKLKDIPLIWDIAELWEIWAKKLFPTEKVGRWLTK